MYSANSANYGVKKMNKLYERVLNLKPFDRMLAITAMGALLGTITQHLMHSPGVFVAAGTVAFFYDKLLRKKWRIKKFSAI